MNCDTALDRLMEADPATLRGQGDGELAAHVAGCQRCAAVAERLDAEVERLDQGLDELLAPGSTGEDGGRAADAAADAALAAIRGEAGADIGLLDETGIEGHARPARPGSGRSWTRHAWVPLAAAAALATVLVLVQSDRPLPPSTSPAPAGPTSEPRVSVTPPADRSAAIMETENPNITIVWLYEREGT